MDTNEDLEFISLFSGIGGLDIGLEDAGMKCICQVEIDPQASAKLEEHWPGLQRFDDVRKVSFRNGKGWKRYKHPRANRKPIDLICGGFPCQDISIAGKREGLAGSRSGLWFEFARIINESRPRWVVIENVSGLLSSNGGYDLAKIVQWLAKRGYGVAWRVLDSQYFGVPQRRRRVFIVGSLGNGRAAQVLFERESGGWHPKKGKKARPRVAGTLDGKSASGDRGSQGNETEFLIAGTLTSQYAEQSGNGMGEMENGLIPNKVGSVNQKWRHTSGPSGAEHQNLIPIAPDVSRALSASDGGVDREDKHSLIAFSAVDNGRDAEEDLSPTLRAMNADKSNQNGGGQVAVAGYNLAPENSGKDFKARETDKSLTVGSTDLTAITFQARIARNGRGQPSEIAPTLDSEGGPTSDKQPLIAWQNRQQSGQIRIQGDTTPSMTKSWGTGGNNVPFIGVRRLTPVECERLQGFPDGWTDGQSDSVRYRQLGNAVTVNVIRWIGKRIVEIDSHEEK